MRKALFSMLALAATGVCAQPQPNLDPCKLMSQEEMLLCVNTRPGDASGARHARCDELSRETMQKCLDQPPREETSASGGTSTPAPEGAAPRVQPPKELPPDEQ